MIFLDFRTGGGGSKSMETHHKNEGQISGNEMKVLQFSAEEYPC